MQTISKIVLNCVILCFVDSCDDEFLDEVAKQPLIRSTNGLYITPSTGYTEYVVDISNAGDATYSIGKYPKWFVFKYLKGNFKNNTTTLKFTVQNIQVSSVPGTYESVLVLVIEKVGIYTIPVYFVNE